MVRVRVVGLDVGERRIGVAVSDSTRTLARPAAVVPVASLAAAVQPVVEAIARVAAEGDAVSCIVVGLPHRLDGSPNALTPRVTAFASALHDRTGLPVEFQDERLTSHEAEQLLSETDPDWRSRKKRLDAVAAAIILQDYLDAHRSRPLQAVDFDS
jgi:putative Holliday junction resolvase